MKKKKIEPLRIIIFIIAVLFIIFMFISKSNTANTTASADEALPVLVTNIAVTFVKVAAIAGVTFIGKKIISKIPKNREE